LCVGALRQFAPGGRFPLDISSNFRNPTNGKGGGFLMPMID
jgi:hypothetical protein